MKITDEMVAAGVEALQKFRNEAGLNPNAFHIEVRIVLEAARDARPRSLMQRMLGRLVQPSTVIDPAED